MRNSPTLTLLAIGALTLAYAAPLPAQDASPVSDPAHAPATDAKDPLLRALGGAGAGTTPTADTPAPRTDAKGGGAGPRPAGVKSVPLLGGVPLVGDLFGDGPQDAGPDAAAADPLRGRVVRGDGRAVDATLWGGTRSWTAGISGGSGGLRVTVDGGTITVTRDGRTVSESQLDRNGNTITVRDEEGRTVATIEVASDGRVTIPAGWTFHGPAQWTTETRSRNVIGIRTGTVETALARHLGLDDGQGILVSDAAEGYPAARAGLQAYDVIVAVDGKRPATLDVLKEVLSGKSTGDTVRLTVVRAGATLQIVSEITTISAPVGRTATLPEGTYALGVDAPGGGTAPRLIYRPDPGTGPVLRGSGDGGLVGRLVEPGTSVLDHFGGSGAATGGGFVGPHALDQDLAAKRAQLPLDWQLRYRVAEEGQRAASAERRVEELEEQMGRLEELLRQLLDDPDRRGAPERESGSRTAPVDGKVIAVRDDAARHDAVALSVGSDDGVQVGDEFVVYREDQFIGKVCVTNVIDDHSTASIVLTGDTTSIRPGDHATTRLGGTIRAH